MFEFEDEQCFRVPASRKSIFPCGNGMINHLDERLFSEHFTPIPAQQPFPDLHEHLTGHLDKQIFLTPDDVEASTQLGNLSDSSREQSDSTWLDEVSDSTRSLGEWSDGISAPSVFEDHVPATYLPSSWPIKPDAQTMFSSSHRLMGALSKTKLSSKDINSCFFGQASSTDYDMDFILPAHLRDVMPKSVSPPLATRGTTAGGQMGDQNGCPKIPGVMNSLKSDNSSSGLSDTFPSLPILPGRLMNSRTIEPQVHIHQQRPRPTNKKNVGSIRLRQIMLARLMAKDLSLWLSDDVLFWFQHFRNGHFMAVSELFSTLPGVDILKLEPRSFRTDIMQTYQKKPISILTVMACLRQLQSYRADAAPSSMSSSNLPIPTPASLSADPMRTLQSKKRSISQTGSVPSNNPGVTKMPKYQSN